MMACCDVERRESLLLEEEESGCTPEEEAAQFEKLVEQIFDEVDLNKDGFIDADEADVLVRAMFAEADINLNIRSYKELLRAFDSNVPYGRIDRSEFRVFFQRQLVHRRPTYTVNNAVLGRLLNSCEQEAAVHQQYIIQAEEKQVAAWYAKKADLGSGRYASVDLWEARPGAPLKLALTGAQFAVKKFSKAGRRKKEMYDVIDEFLMMRQSLNRHGAHPNVIQLYQMIETNRSLYMMIEYCPGGDLYKLVKSRMLTEPEARSISAQILLGLQYIHANDIMHLDLKPENVMVDQLVRSPFRIKIADFGLSEVLVDRGQSQTRFPGSPLYCSPEIFAKRKDYDEKTDLWSVGIMLHEMICGVTPFRGARQIKELQMHVKAFKGFEISGDRVRPTRQNDSKAQGMVREWDQYSTSPAARRVLARLLSPEMERRPSATLILQEPWYASILPTLPGSHYRHEADFTTKGWDTFREVLNKITFDLRAHSVGGNSSFRQRGGRRRDSRDGNRTVSSDPRSAEGAPAGRPANDTCNVESCVLL